MERGSYDGWAWRRVVWRLGRESRQREKWTGKGKGRERVRIGKEQPRRVVIKR